MAFATLGKQLDIHTGGEDLMYTHHNGEIAQAECLTGKSFVNTWLHNAFVTMNDSKMAKSDGSGMTLETLVEKGYSPLDYRYWLLQSHYRSTASFTLEALDAAKQALTRLRRFVYEELGEQPLATPNNDYEERFATTINNDLDTPKALALLWELIKDETIGQAEKLATIQIIDSVLEIGLSAPLEDGLASLGQLSQTDIPEDIQAILAERDLARTAYNWPESDRLRDLLNHKGYQVEDSKDGAKITKST